jgi:hypothetical protein
MIPVRVLVNGRDRSGTIMRERSRRPVEWHRDNGFLDKKKV